MTGDSGIVTGDSGKAPEIGHDKTESVVTIARNRRSRSNGMGGHDGPEYAIAAKACELAVERLSSKVDLSTVQVFIEDDNLASQRVAQKLGWQATHSGTKDGEYDRYYRITM